MYIYSIPYFMEEHDVVSVANIFSYTELSLKEVLVLFLEEHSHSFLDENYEEYEPFKLLEIMTKTFKTSVVSIEHIVGNKIKKGSYPIARLYTDLFSFNKLISYLKEQEEILLSSEILYKGYIHADCIFTSYHGTEVFLFHFDTEAKNKMEDDFEFLEDYVEYDHGLDIPTYLKIDKPLKNVDEIITIFREWARIIGLDLTNKTVRLAKHEDFTRRPFLEELLDRDSQENHDFYTPSDLMFFSKKDVPPHEELIERLKEEPAGVIACVIDNFKNSTILSILDDLPHKKEEVIKLFPLIHCLTFEERRRFIDLFEYTEDYAKHRLQVLDERFGSKEVLQNKSRLLGSEEDALAEYLAWAYYFDKKA